MTLKNTASVELLLDEIRKLQAQIIQIEGDITVSGVTDVPVTTAGLAGLNVSYLTIGSQFNFFGTGSLNAGISLVNGQTYFLATSSQIAALGWYLGGATASTLWITSGATAYSLPLKFDATGIYLTPATQLSNLASGTTFNFTQTLFLAPS